MARRPPPLLSCLSLLALACAAGCAGTAGNGGGSIDDAGDTDAPSAPSSDAGASVAVVGATVDTRVHTEDHMIAALEMQLSGEPLAEAMGRDLSGYLRAPDMRDLYTDPSVAGAIPRTDLAGYASGVESYEYSKQAMNSVAFESGAGTALAFGPVLDPDGASDADALARLRARVQQLGAASNATSRFVHAAATATNPLGWPGLWPVLHPFASFDPAVHATNAVDLSCSITSDDDALTAGTPLVSDDYECDYTSLHLPDRDAQTQKLIGPGPSGWADWKDALWAQNYLLVMHDSTEAAVDHVPDAQRAQVGAPGNTVVGAAADGTATAAGTFLGSSDIEGFQAGLFLDMLDNQAEHWLRALTTTDGATLGGFASVRDALAYGASDPVRWFPAEIAVTEAADASGFPRPQGYAIHSSDSRLLDLAGLVGAYATAYALTDQANPDVGGTEAARAYFDGDPFPQDDQLADGEATLHDRALAMLRVLVVNLDRLHRDPATGLLVDGVAFNGATPAPSGVVSTDAAAYALVALRTARRSLGSTLTLYGNTRPDTAGVPTALDAFPLDPAAPGVTFGARLDALLDDNARAFLDRLTDAQGRAFSGWDLARAQPTDDGGNLDAHTAAVRGLLAGYLATGDTRLRDRARLVYERIESVFYDSAARVYRARVDDTSRDVTFTPRRFGLLQGALRDTYELIAAQPGNDALAAQVTDRIARLDKLVLNGWDDRNGDGALDWPRECVQVTGDVPRGGLQMAERTLTGDTGSEAPTAGTARIVLPDRDFDCVPEVSAAGLPATLADSITFHLENPQ